MLLRNYDNIMTGYQKMGYGNFTVSTDVDYFGDGTINVKGLNNSDQLNINSFSISSSGGRSAAMPLSLFTEGEIYPSYSDIGYCNLIAGEGVKENEEDVSYERYELKKAFAYSDASKVSNSLSFENSQYEEETGSWTYTVSRLFCANRDLTIGEIGIYYNVADSKGYTIRCLVYHEFLDEPIEVKQYSNFKINFSKTVYANPNKPDTQKATVIVE